MPKMTVELDYTDGETVTITPEGGGEPIEIRNPAVHSALMEAVGPVEQPPMERGPSVGSPVNDEVPLPGEDTDGPINISEEAQMHALRMKAVNKAMQEGRDPMQGEGGLG